MTQKLSIGGTPPKPPSPRPESEITEKWKGDISKPRVSILCHCFNHEAFITDALNGFLMQRTNFPWEIIVHDDASTDQTAHIIEEYTKRYPNIIKPIYQSVNQYNQGKKPVLFSMKAAKGDFFAFCEGDDYWLDPNKLQAQKDFLEKHSEYAVCGHNACIIADNKIVKLSKLENHEKRDATSQQLSEGFFVLTLTAMFRTCYDQTPWEHNKVVNGDTFMFSRLGSTGGYKYIDTISPAVYRRHEGGIWSSKNRKEKILRLVETYYWISLYYKRTQKKQLSTFYSEKAAMIIFEAAAPLTLYSLTKSIYRLAKLYIRQRVNFLLNLIKK